MDCKFHVLLSMEIILMLANAQLKEDGHSLKPPVNNFGGGQRSGFYNDSSPSSFLTAASATSTQPTAVSPSKSKPNDDLMRTSDNLTHIAFAHHEDFSSALGADRLYGGPSSSFLPHHASSYQMDAVSDVADFEAASSTIDTSCVFNFDSSIAKSGNFTSPGWPNHYSNGIHCVWNFFGNQYEAINLTFNVFDLEEPYTKGCLTDYVDISTITAFNVKRLIGRFCGRKVPVPLISMHPRLELIMKTNHVITRQGFQGTFQFLDESLMGPPISKNTQNITQCGGVETGFGGIIYSPLYPNRFPESIDCLWLIRVDQGQHIYLRVVQLDLFGSIANCKDAQLAIYNGYENFEYDPKEPKRYCGDLRYYKNYEDKVMLSPRNRIVVRFKSDIKSEKWQKRGNRGEITGFKLVWTAITFKQKDDCREFLCKNSAFCLQPTKGFGQPCPDLKYFCIDRRTVCDGELNCSDQDVSDEDKCNISLLTGASAAIGVTIFVLLMCCCCCRRRNNLLNSNPNDQDQEHAEENGGQTPVIASTGSSSSMGMFRKPSSSVLYGGVEGRTSVSSVHQLQTLAQTHHNHLLSNHEKDYHSRMQVPLPPPDDAPSPSEIVGLTTGPAMDGYAGGAQAPPSVSFLEPPNVATNRTPNRQPSYQDQVIKCSIHGTRGSTPAPGTPGGASSTLGRGSKNHHVRSIPDLQTIIDPPQFNSPGDAILASMTSSGSRLCDIIDERIIAHQNAQIKSSFAGVSPAKNFYGTPNRQTPQHQLLMGQHGRRISGQSPLMTSNANAPSTISQLLSGDDMTNAFTARFTPTDV